MPALSNLPRPAARGAALPPRRPLDELWSELWAELWAWDRDAIWPTRRLRGALLGAPTRSVPGARR